MEIIKIVKKLQFSIVLKNNEIFRNYSNKLIGYNN
jgi:hypothetical protein